MEAATDFKATVMDLGVISQHVSLLWTQGLVHCRPTLYIMLSQASLLRVKAFKEEARYLEDSGAREGFFMPLPGRH